MMMMITMAPNWMLPGWSCCVNVLMWQAYFEGHWATFEYNAEDQICDILRWDWNLRWISQITIFEGILVSVSMLNFWGCISGGLSEDKVTDLTLPRQSCCRNRKLEWGASECGGSTGSRKNFSIARDIGIVEEQVHDLFKLTASHIQYQNKGC